MAWNEPGKPGQDPWGGNRPPRKDSSADAVEQVKRQLEGFLGKIGQQSGGQNDSSATPPEGLGVGMGVVGGAAVAIWLAFGIYIVDPAERGVVTVFGAFTEET